MTEKPFVEIYADGSCSGNPGPGGYAAILCYRGREKVITGGEQHTTNNRMELTAVIEALKCLKKPCKVIVRTDSQYVVNGVNQWLPEWIKRNWKTSSGKRVLNRDLWEELLNLISLHEVSFEWIPRNKHPKIALCDKLARKEASKAGR